MSDWLKNLVGYMLVVSVAMQMLPNKKYEQYLRLFTGFLLIVLVLQPILKIGSADSFLESKVNEFVQEQEDLEEKIAVQKEEFRQESERIEEESGENIEVPMVEEVKVEVTMDD